MRVAQSLIDQIIDRVDIVDLIHARYPLKKSGSGYTACCPFHQEKSPSFHVQREKGFYHCFGCQASGNAIGFLMNYERLGFMEALELLAKMAGVTLPKAEFNNDAYQYVKNPLAKPSITAKPAGPAQPPAQASTAMRPAPAANSQVALAKPVQGDLSDLLAQISQYYQGQLGTSATAKTYLAKRLLHEQTCQYWCIGYAPDGWQNLISQFGADVDGLKKLQLLRSSDQGREYDLFRDRLMFTIRNNKGKVVGFGGRALSDDVQPKYINSPESVVFKKNEILFGMYEALQNRAQQWLMVEGYLDVIMLHQQGITGAVAAMGTASNEAHLLQLYRYHPVVTLAFDGDAAGKKAAWRALENALPLLNDGRELRFLILPDGHDPDSLVRQEGAMRFKQRIAAAPPLSEFIYSELTQQYTAEQLAQPEYKALIYNKCKYYIAKLPSEGVFKRLLEQQMRNNLGLGWQGKKAVQATAIDYSVLALEDKLVGWLLQFPVLCAYVLPIINVLEADNVLRNIALLVQQFNPQLSQHNPVNAGLDNLDLQAQKDEQALFFVLGAWADEAQKQKLVSLLEQTMAQTGIAIEQLGVLFQELLLIYAHQALRRQKKALPLAQKVAHQSLLVAWEKSFAHRNKDDAANMHGYTKALIAQVL